MSVGGSAVDRREASVTWEIKSSEIKLGAKLGQGAFGAVYRARTHDSLPRLAPRGY
jgi:hypothetical protein